MFVKLFSPSFSNLPCVVTVLGIAFALDVLTVPTIFGGGVFWVVAVVCLSVLGVNAGT